jgi:phage terminase large subunit-like protein
MEMLERGFKFRRSRLLLMITNSGTDRNSICWEEHEHAVKVAAGNRDARTTTPVPRRAIDDTTFSYVCGLDPGDDPLNDPSCWPKANPLLGVTITEEYLAGVVAQAKAMPGKLNGILRLHFCRWTDAETAWMTRELLEPCLAEFDPAEHHGKRYSKGSTFRRPRHHRQGVGGRSPEASMSKSRSTARSRSSASRRSTHGLKRGRPATRSMRER